VTLPAPPDGAREVTVAAARLRKWLRGFDERHDGLQLDSDGTTVLLTGRDGDRAWIDVPFPPLPELTGTALAKQVALAEHVERPRRVGVLLVRRTGYAAGLFDGTELVSSKVDSTYVQGTTKAGGWSQQRYARRRANQAHAAFAEAADVAARILGDAELDALVAGGDREAVKSVLADPRLAHLEPTGPWLTVKDPKLRVLQAMPEQFLGIRITLDP